MKVTNTPPMTDIEAFIEHFKITENDITKINNTIETQFNKEYRGRFFEQLFSLAENRIKQLEGEGNRANARKNLQVLKNKFKKTI
jgi:hypothetical protein